MTLDNTLHVLSIASVFVFGDDWSPKDLDMDYFGFCAAESSYGVLMIPNA